MLDRDARPGRERQVEPREDRESEVELPAGGGGPALDVIPIEIGDEPADEEGGSHPAEVRAGCSGAAEAQRRQVPLDERSDEVAPADLVQLHAGKAVVLAVSLFVAMVHVV